MRAKMAGHFRNHFRTRRGASLVEYALLLVAVLLLAAGGFKLLGGSVAKRSAAASDTVTANGGAGPDGPGGGGTAGAAGVRGHAQAGAESDGRQGDVAEGFAGKKWFAVGLLATGIGALGYAVFAMRKAKADAQS